MANNGKNIVKIPVDGGDIRKAIKAAGYSIRSISKKIGYGDRTLRNYLNKDEMPVPMLNAIEKVVGDCLFFPGYKFTEASKDHADDAIDALAHAAIYVKNDNVNHPGHYTFGSIEVIDYIRDKMTPDEFQGYCMGNVLKYVSRHKHKNGVEDLKKARVYLGWLIESEEDQRIPFAPYDPWSYGVEPNFPEGQKVRLVHFDPGTGVFTEAPEEIVHRKNSNSDNEKDGV